ncbi:hypothetical protein [Vibrio tubiashii]|uniref:hypothetical protein n=1 Tax=Vibrio tubiashii TaxID=29498 RepID=UPI00349E680F
MENWKTGKLENWKTGKLENWKVFEGWHIVPTFFSMHYVVILKSEERVSWGSLKASRIHYEIPYSFLRQSME